MEKLEYIEIKQEPDDFEVEYERPSCEEENSLLIICSEPAVNIFECHKCEMSFISRTRLERHNSKIHQEIFECDHCAWTFDDSMSLTKHLKMEHNKNIFKKDADVGDGKLDLSEKADITIANEPFVDSDCSENMDSSCGILKQKNSRNFRIAPSLKQNKKCCVCDKIFKNWRIFQLHMQQQHKKKYWCIYCPVVYNKNNSLQKHMNIKHFESDETFACKYCNKVYGKKNSCIAHMLRNHHRIRDDLFLCKPCNLEFNNFDDFSAHERTDDHVDKVIEYKEIKNKTVIIIHMECDVCGKIFTNKNQFIKHFKRTHERIENAEFPCQMCTKSYAIRDSLLKHIKRIHTVISDEEKIEYKCSRCTKVYTKYESLRVHMKRAHLDNSDGDNVVNELRCDNCDITFDTKFKLGAHRQSNHRTTLFQFKCEYCDHYYASSKSLAYHCKKKHVQEEYKCRNCLEYFKSAELLEQHKGNTCSIKCVFCPKRFVNMRFLLQHQRANHPSSFRFFCDVCGLGYHFEEKLRHHINTRHRDKPTCNKQFNTRQGMELHVEKDH